MEVRRRAEVLVYQNQSSVPVLRVEVLAIAVKAARVVQEKVSLVVKTIPMIRHGATVVIGATALVVKNWIVPVRT
jgi:hypothetical protein